MGSCRLRDSETDACHNHQNRNRNYSDRRRFHFHPAPFLQEVRFEYPLLSENKDPGERESFLNGEKRKGYGKKGDLYRASGEGVDGGNTLCGWRGFQGSRSRNSGRRWRHGMSYHRQLSTSDRRQFRRPRTQGGPQCPL